MNSLKHFLRPLRRWSAYRSTYAALSSLDDKTLRDINVDPRDIRAAARRAAQQRD